MAQVSWSQRLDPSAITKLLTSPQRGVAQDMLRRGLKVETAAKRNLGGIGGPKRVDTGRLRSSISTQLVTRNGVPAVIVGTNVYYALWVHNGTGVYGPAHRLIRPKVARRLKFKPSGSTRFVYARFVVGMKPNPFLKNALPAARD
jgi:phage gpG-like protein